MHSANVEMIQNLYRYTITYSLFRSFDYNYPPRPGFSEPGISFDYGYVDSE